MKGEGEAGGALTSIPPFHTWVTFAGSATIGRIGGRIRGERDQVGVVTGLEQAGPRRLRAQGERPVGRRRLDRGQGGEPGLDQQAEFGAVLAPARGRGVAGTADVGAQRDAHAALVGERDRGGVPVGHLEQLAVRVLGQAAGGPVGEVLLDDQPGGHQHRVALAHRVGGLLVEVGAVLDGAHPRPQGRHDARLAVAVRRDDPLGAPRLLDDRAQLLVAELLVHGVIDLAHHAARGAHLDHPRADTELEPDGPQALGYPVALAQHADPVGEVADPVRREHVQVGVAPGGTEHRSGAVDRRARRPSPPPPPWRARRPGRPPHGRW